MSNTALATKGDQVPAHILKSEAYTSGVGRGNEEVGQNLTIPRVKQLQKMSNEVDKHHNDYVEGAEPGDFFNSLTGENYGSELYVISLKFKTEHVVWRDRTVGGGYGGAFQSAEAANKFIAEQEKSEEWACEETHSHVLLIKDPETGDLTRTPVIMDFSRSKLRVSKAWNSQIGMKGGDRFAGLWKLYPVSTANRAGEQFLNLGIDFHGWCIKEDYEAAEALFKGFND